MNNDDLRGILYGMVGDEEELNKIVILEGDEYADGAVGLSNDNHVIYDYNKLVESLMKHNNWSDTEAIEWLEYNTLRAIPYMKAEGKEPIILINFDED